MIFETDDISRRKWQNQLGMTNNPLYDLICCNSLRFVHWSSAHMSVRILGELYVGDNAGTFHELKQRLNQLVEIKREEYKKRGTQARMNYVKSIKDVIYGLLRFLSKQSPASQPN